MSGDLTELEAHQFVRLNHLQEHKMLRSDLFANDSLLEAIAADSSGQRISKTHNRQVPSVCKIQKALLIWDPNCLPRFGADCDYGDETAAAVHRFKLVVLGITEANIVDDVGPQTVLGLDQIAFTHEQNGTPATAFGVVRPLANVSGLATSVNASAWSPVEESLVSEFVFKWTSVTGRGTISYFQLDDMVVPRWFGALVPNGLSSFDKAHIFFHPTPAQAEYKDAQYHGLGNWTSIFHYLSESMGVQFCAAGTDRVLIMPLMSESAATDCGVFPQHWETISGRIFGMLKSGDFSLRAPILPISSVVISSFSAGIAYSHQFRSRANLGAKLAGVIDFDGVHSSYRQYSAAISVPTGHVVKLQQMPATQQELGPLNAQGINPLPLSRWSGKPWAEEVLPDHVHGLIPQMMMCFAARRAG